MTAIDKVQYLQIGVQGENVAMNVELDMTAWAEQYPDATFHILFKPYNEPEVSPQTSTYDSSTHVLTWTVGAGATAIVGVGYTEIRAQDGGNLIKKTRIIPTAVENSVSGVEVNPPAAYADWVANVLNAGAAVVALSHGTEISFSISDGGHLVYSYTDEDDETVTVDLGPVDAYAMAVAKGYEGTKEEFEQYMADVADAAADAKASAEEAAQYTSDAVHTWLEENIDPDSGYALDRTLTEPLEAAPADLVGNLKSALSEETRNLWTWGDQNSFTGAKTVTSDANLPAGTYTMSALAEKTGSQSNIRMLFYKNSITSSNLLADPYISSGSRNAVTFTIAEKADIIRVCSGVNSSSSAIASWKDVQIESGSIGTDYVPPVTAKDCEARNEIESNNKADRNAKNNYSKKDDNTSEWEQGIFNYTNGEEYPSTKRIRTKGYISIDKGVIGVTANTGYEFSVYAWNKEGTYIGALSPNGTFVKAGLTAHTFIKEYWFDKYPDYKFRIALRNATNPDEDVDISENANCKYYLCRYASTETAEQIQDEINSIIPANMIDEQPTESGGIFVANGDVTPSTTLAHTDYIDLTGIEEIIYTRIYTNAKRAVWGMAFYDENKTYISGQAPVINNKTYTYGYSSLEVPEDAKYARFSWYAPLGDFELYNVESYNGSITNRISKLEEEVEEIKKDTNTLATIGLHIEPENVGQLNVIKRCRQLTDIKWIPAVDLPRLMMVQRSGVYDGTVTAEEYEGVFKAGTEYTGIPYGRANDIGDYGYSHGFVGKDIDIETFVTSVANPESMLCKESQFDLSDHESTKYACVCSALTTYALNVPYKTTAQIPSITGLVRIGKINDNGTLISEDSFKLGDVLNITGYHTAIVTDICKDEDGHLLFIELSDASTAGLADKNHADGQIGGVCRRKGWTKDQIYAAGSWGDYDLYRYQYIEDVPYTPSQYVNVGDELNMWRIEQMPCMPYPGNGFVYDKDNIPNTDIIIAQNLGYSCLRVFKDGTEITGSPFAITSETKKVATGFSDVGNYIAYLSTMQNGHDKYVSYKCNWTVK